MYGLAIPLFCGLGKGAKQEALADVFLGNEVLLPCYGEPCILVEPSLGKTGFLGEQRLN